MAGNRPRGLDRRRGTELLHDGARILGISPDPGATESLLDYLDLLGRWSRAMRLTGLRDPNDWVETHLLDSLSVLRVLGEEEVLVDIGSGGGLPGIPLFASRPRWRGTLFERHGRRAVFLRQAVAHLGLGNRVEVREGDAEAEAAPAYSSAVSRATWSPDRWAFIGAGWVRPGGRVVGMLGREAADETTLRHLGTDAGLDLECLDCFRLPFSGAARALVVWRQGRGRDSPHPR